MKMKKMIKKLGRWYFNNYLEFYRPMIEAGCPIII